MISAYPLTWPDGWPRTHAVQRVNGRFSKSERVYRDGAPSYNRQRELTVTDGVTRALEELGRMGIDRQDVVISTNVRTRLDGLPRSGERRPDDPGSAVYWETRKRERRVMAIDRYTTVEDNLAAIAATLEAMRAIERHGGAQILDRAFTGFAALPAPAAGARLWRDVLGFASNQRVTGVLVQQHYRARASMAHPDKGGTHDEMIVLNAARDAAIAELEQALNLQR